MDRSVLLLNALCICAALGAGCLMAMQPAVNGKLASGCSHPLQASVISFGTGFLALVAVGIALRIGFPELANLKLLPWWAWFGGLIGTYMVTVSLMVAPNLGASRWIALVLAGQISLSLVLDHFGLLGYSQQSMNSLRIVGVGCIVVGVILVMRN